MESPKKRPSASNRPRTGTPVTRIAWIAGTKPGSRPTGSTGTSIGRGMNSTGTSTPNWRNGVSVAFHVVFLTTAVTNAACGVNRRRHSSPTVRRRVLGLTRYRRAREGVAYVPERAGRLPPPNAEPIAERVARACRHPPQGLVLHSRESCGADANAAHTAKDPARVAAGGHGRQGTTRNGGRVIVPGVDELSDFPGPSHPLTHDRRELSTLHTKNTPGCRHSRIIDPSTRIVI